MLRATARRLGTSPMVGGASGGYKTAKKPFVQDMPPPGGYKTPYRDTRPPASRGPTGAVMWGTLLAVTVVGFYGVRAGAVASRAPSRLQDVPLTPLSPPSLPSLLGPAPLAPWQMGMGNREKRADAREKREARVAIAPFLQVRAVLS